MSYRKDYEQSNVGLGMVPCKPNCRCSDCTIERLRARVAELEAERDRLRGLVKHANCPNCDGSGAYPHGPDPDGNWELKQCQWCYERRAELEETNVKI